MNVSSEHTTHALRLAYPGKAVVARIEQMVRRAARRHVLTASRDASGPWLYLEVEEVLWRLPPTHSDYAAAFPSDWTSAVFLPGEKEARARLPGEAPDLSEKWASFTGGGAGGIAGPPQAVPLTPGTRLLELPPEQPGGPAPLRRLIDGRLSATPTTHARVYRRFLPEQPPKQQEEAQEGDNTHDGGGEGDAAQRAASSSSTRAEPVWIATHVLDPLGAAAGDLADDYLFWRHPSGAVTVDCSYGPLAVVTIPLTFYGESAISLSAMPVKAGGGGKKVAERSAGPDPKAVRAYFATRRAQSSYSKATTWVQRVIGEQYVLTDKTCMVLMQAHPDMGAYVGDFPPGEESIGTILAFDEGDKRGQPGGSFKTDTPTVYALWTTYEEAPSPLALTLSRELEECSRTVTARVFRLPSRSVGPYTTAPEEVWVDRAMLDMLAPTAEMLAARFRFTTRATGGGIVQPVRAEPSAVADEEGGVPAGRAVAFLMPLQRR